MSLLTEGGTSMYVILTSKPGQYRTELTSNLRPVETYDYMFYGSCKARFVIAEMQGAGKFVVVDETPPEVINHIPSKFFQQFQTVAQARRQLQDLARPGDADVALVQI